MSLQVSYGLQLPVVQTQARQHFIRQPIAPECDNERSCTQLEIRLGQTDFSAENDHGLGTRTDSLDVASQVQRLSNERIVGDRGMCFAQIVERQRSGKSTGIPDFEPIGE